MTVPAEVPSGKVVGRFVKAVADGSDAGSEPDVVAAVGSVRFTPQAANQRAVTPELVTVTSHPVVSQLDVDGYLVDSQGAKGVWLPVGFYDVVFNLRGIRIHPTSIYVQEGYTDAAPLDLAVAIPPAGPPIGSGQYAELSQRITVLEAGGGGGVSDHGALTGLDDDDHPQYLTRARGDALYSGGAAAASRYVPVIIFNGESNSGGHAQNSLATAHELAPRPCIQIFDNAGLTSFQDLDIGTNNLIDHDMFTPPIPSERHGWELGLANSVEAGEWFDSTVYLVKTGQGGSKIADWNVSGAYWQKFLTRTRAALSLLRSQGKVPVIYLWYTLGINDMGAGTPMATWQSGVQAYFKRVREELGYIPIFAVEFMPGVGMESWNSALHTMAVDDHMLQIIDSVGASTIPPGQFAEIYHWDYSGMKTLASRLGSASRNFGQHEGFENRRIDTLAGSAQIVTPPNLPTLVRNPASVSFLEGSAGASFTVALSQAPTASVTVAVAASGGNVVPNKSSLTFTTSNWSTGQSVTVTSADDGAGNGNRTSTVTLSSASVAAPVTVSVTVTDAFVASGPANTVLPAITGSTALAGVLTCSTGTWSNGPTGYTYQWLRDGAAISGATANTRTVAAADQGHTLSCAVTASNGAGANTAASAGTSVPAAPVAPVNTGLPAISGTLEVGSTLTSSSGTWQQSPTAYAYQWKRNGVDIASATASTYLVVAADAGKTLTCAVTASNAVGPTTATSAGVDITAALVPVAWSTFQNASSSGNGVLTITTLPGGGMDVNPVDLTKPFSVEVELTSDAVTTGLVFAVDDDNNPVFTWPDGQFYVFGFFNYSSTLNKCTFGSDTTAIGGLTMPCKVKAVKSGNDIVFYTAPIGGSYGAPLHTYTGVLTGKTTGYIKCMGASGGGNLKAYRTAPA